MNEEYGRVDSRAVTTVHGAIILVVVAQESGKIATS